MSADSPTNLPKKTLLDLFNPEGDNKVEKTAEELERDREEYWRNFAYTD